jgi:hypothetical protein
MRYRVIGTDAKSKKPIEVIIDAADEAEARADAAGRGVVVERVEAAEMTAKASPGPSLTLGVRGIEPVLVRVEPGHVQLIELTAKKWKGLLLVSLGVMVVGVVVGGWFLLRDPRSFAHPPVMAWIGGVVSLIGLLGVVVARVGAWWGHG